MGAIHPSSNISRRLAQAVWKANNFNQRWLASTPCVIKLLHKPMPSGGESGHRGSPSMLW